MKEGAPRKGRQGSSSVRPQVYISAMLVMLMLILAYMGQWDWVLAVFIGLLLGNGFSVLRRG